MVPPQPPMRTAHGRALRHLRGCSAVTGEGLGPGNRRKFVKEESKIGGNGCSSSISSMAEVPMWHREWQVAAGKTYF